MVAALGAGGGGSPRSCGTVRTLYEPDVATLGDIREAVSTLEDVGRIARRVLGSAHPNAAGIEGELEDARAALRASG